MTGKVYGDGFCVIPDAVLYAPRISANAKLLWGVYARHADAEGRSYPSRSRLAALLSVSEDTVKRAKKELVDAGLVSVRERFDDQGRRTTDDVILHHARRKSAPPVGCKSAPPYIEAFELEPEELEARERGRDAALPPGLPPEARARGAEFVRYLRTGMGET